MRRFLIPILLLLAAPAFGAAPALTLKQGSAVDGSDTVKSDLSIAAASVSAAADTFTSAGHSLTNGETVILYTSGTLPSPLAAWTEYWVVGVSGDTFKLASESGGTAIDLTDQGTGTHTVVWLLTEAELDANFVAVKNAILEAPDDETRAWGDDGDVKTAWDSADARWEWRSSADAVKAYFDPSTGYLYTYGLGALGSDAYSDLGNSSDPSCTGVADSAGRIWLNTPTGLGRTCRGETVENLFGPTVDYLPGADRTVSPQEANRPGGAVVYHATAKNTFLPVETNTAVGAEVYHEVTAAVTAPLCPPNETSPATQIQRRGQTAETAGNCVENSSAAIGDYFHARRVAANLWREVASSGTWAGASPPAGAFCTGTYLFCYDVDHASGTLYAYKTSGSGSVAGTNQNSATIDAAYGSSGNGLLIDASTERIRFPVSGTDIVDTEEGTVTLTWNPRATTGTSYLFVVWQDASNRIFAYRNSSSKVVLVHQGNGGDFNSLTSDDSLTATAWNTIRVKWSVSSGEIGVEVNGGTWKTSSVTVAGFAAGTRYVYTGDYAGGVADATWIDNYKITGTYDP